VIQSFACQQTQRLYPLEKVRGFIPALQRIALRKLAQLDAVTDLQHLRVPPGNRLEALSGSLQGFYSIRLNDQWRLCFRWQEDGPHDVKIVDYH
jgi:toxin HigB-1